MITQNTQNEALSNLRRGGLGWFITGAVRVIAYVNEHIAESLLARIPSRIKNFIATVDYDGITLRIFTGESLGRRMYYLHDFEHDQRDLLYSLMTAGEIFYDVGANIGYYSILAAKKGMKVFAFEPFPNFCQFTKENAVLNAVEKRITVVQEALADQVGTTTFYPPRVGNWGVGKIFSQGPVLTGSEAVGEPIEVPTLTLDDAVTRFGMPSLVKIDIEGAEYFLLKNNPAVLSRLDAPTLFIEFHPTDIASLGGSVDGLRSILINAGYREYTISQTQTDTQTWGVYSKRKLSGNFIEKMQ